VLTNASLYPASTPVNVDTPPEFVSAYFNGSRSQTIVLPEPTMGIQVPAAFDEGGNFIRPLFGPLSLTAATGEFFGNHHVTAGVNGRQLNVEYGVGSVPAGLLFDFDRNARPLTNADGGAHRGADQKPAAPAPTTPITPE
jgi:hypothetical protein